MIPAKDAASTIAAALASVSDQSYPVGEVIVVDDGSSDSTGAIAESHGAKVLRNEKPLGPSAARNAGIAAASGELVAFLDADDVWHRSKTERQVALLGANPSAVAAATDWARSEAAWATAPPKDVPTTSLSYPDFLLMNQFQTSTVIARREALERIGGFLSDLDGVEDWDCWLRLSKLGPIVKADWPYVLYRDSPTGVSKDLATIYARMRLMLARERSEGIAGAPHGESILAWHHMRFALNWALEGDRASARVALGDLGSEGLTRHAPAAFARYMLPFLARRALKRLPVLERSALARRIPALRSSALHS